MSRDAYLCPSNQMLGILQARGPDNLQSLQRCVSAADPFYLTFASSVLSLRGKRIVTQPKSFGKSGPVLCWNGEGWKRRGVPLHGNDTDRVFQDLFAMLEANSWQKAESKTRRREIALYFSGITGPFSFVLFDDTSSTIYFSRDQIGRRSLVLQNSGAEAIQISSVGDSSYPGSCIEIKSSGIHSINFNDQKRNIQADSLIIETDEWVSSQCDLTIPFTHEISTRKRSIKSEMILEPVSEEETISRIQSCQTYLTKSMHLRLGSIQQPRGSNSEHRAEPSRFQQEQYEKVGILFSGGLDCTVLARLAHNILPLNEPIALINVAFENPRLATNDTNSVGFERENDIYEKCPDRKTARRSFEELCNTCLGRDWRFVVVNVPHDETKRHYSKVVSLMRPHNTEMDLSIALALYFASRGEGLLCEKAKMSAYSTRARVLISGLGADELFGGYLRHATAYKRGGVNKLIEELQLDIDRVGDRNLGRDDRVTTCWGKEVRYPYLDEEFIDWLLQIPISLKYAFWANETMDQATLQTSLGPSKYLLRRLAMTLGLRIVALERKRAIQFGSRSAKMLHRKVQGTDTIT